MVSPNKLLMIQFGVKQLNFHDLVTYHKNFSGAPLGLIYELPIALNYLYKKFGTILLYDYIWSFYGSIKVSYIMFDKYTVLILVTCIVEMPCNGCYSLTKACTF